jgi:hypothetical protein
MDGILINRRKQHPEEDPISDPIYVAKTAYVVLYGICALGPFGMFYLLIHTLLRIALGREPTYE